MTDTGIAPPAAAPSSSSGGSQDVPVNMNPTAAPLPVGSQAPPAPVTDLKGSAHRTESRRESILKAFRDVEKGEVGPARMRMGHNNPPEATRPDRVRPKPAQAQQPRAEHGHFAGSAPGQMSRQTATTAPMSRQTATNRDNGQVVGQTNRPKRPPPRPLPADAKFREPPQRMSQKAKVWWHGTPRSVRGEVHRMHNEFAHAYQSYRDDHETMNSIRHFNEMARSHGTTLQRALSNYVGIEDRLRSDPIGGLSTIVNNLNLRTPQGQRITLSDIAYHVLSQTPEQQRLATTENTNTALTHHLSAQAQHIARLEQGMQQMQYERQFATMRAGVDRFAETHPRLDELGPQIAAELPMVGYNLEAAYQRADRLYPPQHAAQTRQPTAQTRRQSRSISGAPDGAVNGNAARQGPPPSRREAIAKAISRVNGSL